MERNIVELQREEKRIFLRNLMYWTSEKLAIESKNKLDEYIKTGEGISFAESYLLGQILLLKNGQSSFFNDYGRFEDINKIIQISAPSLLTNYIFNGKVFKLTEPVYDLLKNTNNRLFLRKHPFYVFAIDQKIQTKYEGLNIIFTIFYEVSTEGKEANGCNYLSLGEDKRDNTEFWITGDINYPMKKYIGDNFFNKEEKRELHKKIRDIYSNFLDYLNHPYAKQSIYVLSHNTKERVKRGKFPRQDKIIIDIKQEFIQKVEVDKEQENKDGYNYKFWVRGHFKHFRNKERFKKLYILSKTELEKKKLFYNGDYISRWIIPYIKGVGKIKEKIRRLR